ncbi:MAG TPA: serine/threonine-protein kinase [Gammaproteobacteria bacterium]
MNESVIHELPVGCRIDDFVIDGKLGGGGFSIVYLAHLADSGKEVVVKEYMPRKLACRGEDGMTISPLDEAHQDQFVHGRKLFLQEASTLANIKHPNIVNVISFFRANGTVYMVMDYEKGVNLQDYIHRHNGGLTEKLLNTVFRPLLDGLRYLHDKGLLHLDIKPGNIYLRAGGNPLLLDFGAVHEMQQSRRYQPGQVLTLGFCPVEQSTPGGYVGPWTDLYAIGATMRACIEGSSPPPAEERRMKETMRPAAELFKKNYSPNLLAAIDWAMEVDPMLRPQNVDQMLAAMDKGAPHRGKTPASESRSMLDRLADRLSWKKN